MCFQNFQNTNKKQLSFMSQLFKEMQFYEENIRAIQLQNNENYFSNKSLLKEVQRTENQIMRMISSLQEVRKDATMRQHVNKQKFQPHPFRKPIQLLTQISSDRLDSAESETFISQFIEINTQIQIKIQPLRIHPIYRKSFQGGRGKTIISQGKYKLTASYLEKVSQSQSFKYCPQLEKNMIKDGLLIPKIGQLRITHKITKANKQLMKSVLKQHKLCLLLQNQFKLLIGLSKLSLYEIYKLTKKEQNYRHNLKKTKNLITFFMMDSKVQLFCLQCEISLQKNLISPMVSELKEKIHLRKVIIKEQRRSRSPSPTLHRQAAKSILQSENIKLVLLNNRQLIYQLEKRWQIESAKISITVAQDIMQPDISVIQDKKQAKIKMLVKLKDEKINGFLMFKLGSAIFQIVIQDKKYIQFHTLQNSKILMKNSEGYDQNIVMAVSPFAYIKVSPIVRIVEHPVQLKVTRFQVSSYFIKSDIESEDYYVYPGSIIQVYKGEKGVTIYFNLDNQQVKDYKEATVIIAMRMKATKPRNQKQNQREKQKIKKIDERKHFFPQSAQICQDHYIQFHVVNCILIPVPNPSLSFYLQVKQIGIYSLVLAGMFSKNSTYLLRSLNENVLRLCLKKVQFDQNVSQCVYVQVMKNIKIKETVVLMVYDKGRRVTTYVNIVMSEKQYWEK